MSLLSAAAWRASTRVDRQRGGEDLLALDAPGLAEVGGGAEVLDGRRGLEDLRRAAVDDASNFVFGLAAGVPPSFLTVAVSASTCGARSRRTSWRGRDRRVLDQAAGDDLLVEVRLEVLERQRVVDDLDVAARASPRGLRAGGGRGRAAGVFLSLPPHAAISSAERTGGAGAADMRGTACATPGRRGVSSRAPVCVSVSGTALPPRGVGARPGRQTPARAPASGRARVVG